MNLTQSVEIGGEVIKIKSNELDLQRRNIKKISDILGLKNCTNLKILNLNHNNLENLNDLPVLESLNVLHLRGNKLISIDGLNKCKNLRMLDLSQNRIKDITEVELLINLEKLNLRNNDIDRISGFNTLINLTGLNITFNKIKVIEGLENLKNLEVIGLGGNPFEKIQGLEKLINLKRLFFNSGQFESISGLDQLKNLEMLDFLNCKLITNISGLEKLENLRRLTFYNCNIKEISGLSSLKRLEILELPHNKIGEIKGLENLLQLEELNLKNNKITEIHGLLNLKKLRKLNIKSNLVKKLEGLEELVDLEELDLRFNLFTGPEEFLVESPGTVSDIVSYCKTKEIQNRQVIFSKYYDSNLNMIENIEVFNGVINDTTEDDLVHIGTHKQDLDIKIIQNILFYKQKPKIQYLLARNSSITKLKLHMIQVNSLRGFKYSQTENEKIDHFMQFIKVFWNKSEIKENVLIYGKKEKWISNKIEEMLTIALSDKKNMPNLIIFPENSIPYSKIRFLQEISYRNNFVIIFGLEHKNFKGIYKNKAIIIDHGILGIQVKQTPVRIYKKDNTYIQENIKCEKIPEIKIFNTSIGKIAIFICKDFLRLNEVVIDWAFINRVNLIVIPSLTNKVLPFHSKLLGLLNYARHKKIKIIFNSMGEYGGSEYFSIKETPRIEETFRLNNRDNVGETIVIREDILDELRCDLCGDLHGLESSSMYPYNLPYQSIELYDARKEVRLLCKNCIKKTPSLVDTWTLIDILEGSTFEEWNEWFYNYEDPHFNWVDFLIKIVESHYDDDWRYHAIDILTDNEIWDGKYLQELIEVEDNTDVKQLLEEKLKRFLEKYPYYELD